MARGAGESVAIGPMVLTPPESCKLFLASDSPERVKRFVRSSPDRTLYHELPVIEFMRGQELGGDLLLLEENGEPRFAVPVYPRDANAIDTMYSGLVLPAATAEKPLRRAVGAFFSLLEANRHLRWIRCTQAFVSAGSMDPERRSLIDYAWSTSVPRRGNEVLFTRILALPGAPDVSLPPRSESGVLGSEGVDEVVMKAHDGDVRNQIRQALRNGLEVRYHVIAGDDPAATDAAYTYYYEMSAASRSRTGLTPRSSEYWRGLSLAVARAGGCDLVVVAVDGGRPVASVVCHLYQAQALYWAGCSYPDGQLKRANPLCLHMAIALSRRFGVRWFELGRFAPQETVEKEAQVVKYKSQFGGTVVRMPSLFLRRPSTRGLLRRVARRLKVDVVDSLRHRFADGP